MLERALEKQNRLDKKLQRIEEHIMTKEMFHYDQIRQKLEAQKADEIAREAERLAKEEERKRLEALQKK